MISKIAKVGSLKFCELTKIYSEHDEVCLRKVARFSKKTMLFLFIISQLLQLAIILYLNTEYTSILLIVSFINVTPKIGVNRLPSPLDKG